MHIQRRGEDAYDWTIYDGAGRVGVDWYFRSSTALPASLMIYHLEPGAEEGEHFHLEGDPDSCSVDSAHELYLCIAGEVVMLVGDEREVLRPGDAAYVPEGVPHGVRNESDSPAEVVLLFGPPTGNPHSEEGRKDAVHRH